MLSNLIGRVMCIGAVRSLIRRILLTPPAISNVIKINWTQLGVFWMNYATFQQDCVGFTVFYGMTARTFDTH